MFKWLKSRRENAREAREILFPEYELRPESNDLLGSFDPFNLALEIQPSSDVRHELDLIMLGKLDEARAIVQAKLQPLDAREKLNYSLQITVGVHELRHFHDHFFTTFGFQRIVRTIEDGMNFHKMWDALKREPVIRLPLAQWAREEDAPAALRSYMAERRDFVEWFTLYDGAVRSVTITGQENTADSLMMIQVKGLQTQVPAILRNVKRASTDALSQWATPMGGRVLMEGAALIIQRQVISRLFGNEYWEPLKQALSFGSMSDDRWSVYMAVDIYLSKNFPKFYTNFQLALTDMAMMPPRRGDLMEIHPGWRLWKLVKAARDIGLPTEEESSDLAKYMERLTAKLEWPSMDEVTDEAIAGGKKFLAEPHDKRGFWFSILSALTDVHLRAMTIRKQQQAVLAQPGLYLGVQHLLPPPMVRVHDHQIEFRGLDEDGAQAMRWWFFFEHFQRQMMFSAELPCAGRRIEHDCPGDALRRGWFRKRWVEGPGCPFSLLVADLGVKDLKFEKL